MYTNYEINYIINVRLSLWYSKVRNRKLGTFDIYIPKVPDFLYIFGTKLKNREKYMKMCKNKKYSKGVVPFGVLVKNMK